VLKSGGAPARISSGLTFRRRNIEILAKSSQLRPVNDRSMEHDSSLLIFQR
jgi:hypothetical protein